MEEEEGVEKAIAREQEEVKVKEEDDKLGYKFIYMHISIYIFIFTCKKSKIAILEASFFSNKIKTKNSFS